MAAPEAGHMLESPDKMVAAHCAQQEHIQGEGGGTYITVPENESAEQTGVGAVRGIVEVAVAVHDKQKHVSISQVGAGWNFLGAELAVLVTERQVPRRVLDHQIQHPGGQLVMMDACIPRRRDRVHGPGFGALDEELMLL